MNKTIISLLLVLVLIFGWAYTATLIMNDEEEIPQETINQINYYREIAEEQRALGAFGKAIECYENIITLDPSIDNYLTLCNVLYEAERFTKYKNTLLTVTSIYPNDSRAFEMIGQYYLKSYDYTECKEICKAAMDKGIATKEIEDLYYESAYTYDTYKSDMPSANRFYNGFSVVKTENGKYYYVNDSLKYDLGPYTYATSFTDTLAAVLDDSDTYYFINLDGEKYLSTSQDYEIAYSFCEGYAIVKTNDGKYKYLSTDNKLSGGEFQYATLYKNGVAGIKFEDSWYIINSAGQQIGTNKYAEIVYDEDNICSNCNVVFVSDGEGYYMIDLSGNRIGNDTYDKVKPFFDSSLAAVCKDGKWGFVNTSGKLVIDYQYEDAQSFGYGCAAVKVDGKWGFVAANNRMVIEPEYEDAKSFSADKICPVMIDGKWSFIKLLA